MEEAEALRNDAEMERLKEQLREIGHKIQFVQSKEQLQAKVELFLTNNLSCKWLKSRIKLKFYFCYHS